MTVQTMNDESEKSSATPAIVLALFAIVVAVFMVKFGLQTMTWVEGKMWASQSPWLNTGPQAFPAPPARPPGPQTKTFGFQMKAPGPGNPKPAPAETFVAFHY